MAKTLLKMWETQVLPLGREDPLEEKTATRNPREYSCLGNPMVRGAGGGGGAAATVHGVAKSRT